MPTVGTRAGLGDRNVSPALPSTRSLRQARQIHVHGTQVLKRNVAGLLFLCPPLRPLPTPGQPETNRPCTMSLAS